MLRITYTPYIVIDYAAEIPKAELIFSRNHHTALLKAKVSFNMKDPNFLIHIGKDSIELLKVIKATWPPQEKIT